MAKSTGFDTAETPLETPAIRTVSLADLRDALAKGLDDFRANRSDIFFLCVIYPVISVLLVRAVIGGNLLPLVFPILAGFTLIGPVIAIVFYEISRRREAGEEPRWGDAIAVVRHTAIGSLAILAGLLLAIFGVWLAVAWGIYELTLGGALPASLSAFARDVFTTPEGWALIAIGNGVGFLFAVLVLAVSVVSFPMLLDREVNVVTAIATSVRVVTANPATMAVWGLIVAVSLAIGCIPLFVGLAIAIPVLGHATWHLYRKAVPR
ncbi:DUF2189 domain-containing protein [Kaustia mangrovi]|uniref:DUF2189 domain-containing protein n=1 Tax=Kaustia mangrovi TaxID=2593653 RepID=A0A7S8C5S4_9HYPH|nr:DUF2189 domain-containing protein [Kaustia mangrovi]QPC43898.1 DUF2189 domain-containing protein [Kaustia mangrovi]